MDVEQNQGFLKETTEAQNMDTTVQQADIPWWKREMEETRNHDLAWSRDRN